MDFEASQLDRLRRIGRGPGGTTVYEALHRPTGKIYAVKVIDGCYEDAVHCKIRRQFQTLRDLQHPNVVQCHGLIDHGGEIQLLLEYMDKGSLQYMHVPEEPYLANLAAQVLRGLAHLHGRSIAHRDIKPSNLLLDRQGTVKIADFGVPPILAQTADLFNPSVLDYMCPERINTDLSRGASDGSAGDIWSFGICFLEFYSGKFPFPVGKEGNWGGLMRAICLAKPPEAPPHASEEFRDFFACCLQTVPEKRPTAAQLLEHPFIKQYARPEFQLALDSQRRRL